MTLRAVDECFRGTEVLHDDRDRIWMRLSWLEKSAIAFGRDIDPNDVNTPYDRPDPAGGDWWVGGGDRVQLSYYGAGHMTLHRLGLPMRARPLVRVPSISCGA